jgi:hypothetical protein
MPVAEMLYPHLSFAMVHMACLIEGWPMDYLGRLATLIRKQNRLSA